MPRLSWPASSRRNSPKNQRSDGIGAASPEIRRIPSTLMRNASPCCDLTRITRPPSGGVGASLVVVFTAVELGRKCRLDWLYTRSYMMSYTTEGHEHHDRLRPSRQEDQRGAWSHARAIRPRSRGDLRNRERVGKRQAPAASAS